MTDEQIISNLKERVRLRTKPSDYYTHQFQDSIAGIDLEELIGVDFNKYKLHLENQFLEGMNWDNMSNIHLDHIKPLSRAMSPEEYLQWWKYDNVRPLWAKANIDKHNRFDHEIDVFNYVMKTKKNARIFEERMIGYIIGVILPKQAELRIKEVFWKPKELINTKSTYRRSGIKHLGDNAFKVYYDWINNPEKFIERRDLLFELNDIEKAVYEWDRMNYNYPLNTTSTSSPLISSANKTHIENNSNNKTHSDSIVLIVVVAILILIFYVSLSI